MSDQLLNRFEGLLKGMSGPDADRFKSALIDVLDTAYACKLWFESYNLPATAADVVAMTRLAMEREAVLKAAEERKADTE